MSARVPDQERREVVERVTEGEAICPCSDPPFTHAHDLHTWAAGKVAIERDYWKALATSRGNALADRLAAQVAAIATDGLAGGPFVDCPQCRRVHKHPECSPTLPEKVAALADRWDAICDPTTGDPTTYARGMVRELRALLSDPASPTAMDEAIAESPALPKETP